ncbi:WD40 repeat [Paraburkholderia fungorum]|uniref:WD40 repeat n=1 Tax=Paraburkholderia fungorum TaxID=134537 RepID=A0A1H1JPD7_9BURK|nr:TIR domain-containing protein [Paraburkholderia fungorum]SDR51307.1 WD40 repeat [Paraburkholderia fungorum]
MRVSKNLKSSVLKSIAISALIDEVDFAFRSKAKMSRIFLSHSSDDNGCAFLLKRWLATQGWDDVFLDLDPLRGIAAGERWERALYNAASRCEVVLFLVSRAWLDSDWCMKEFNLASRLNKRLFGVLIEDIPIRELPATLTGTWQVVPLASGHDHIMLSDILPGTHEEVHATFSQEGLTRLRGGLERAGLDARFFAWPPADDPDRAPYRGLLPLEAADAGIFFGREARMIEALDRIRGIKDGVSPRLLILLGASGAGKSSFLRAGLLPRLRRDERNYFPLPVIRPERSVINGDAGLVYSLAAAFKIQGHAKTMAAIREAVSGGATTLRSLLDELVAHAHRGQAEESTAARPPMLVLAIDQGEELFIAESATESAAFLALLRDLMGDPESELLVLVTIRSDAYEQLQTAKELEGIIQRTQSLTPMPRGAYQLVIEGPAARMKDSSRPLEIKPALVDALLADIEEGGSHDALPLLSFTLERLYREYGASGHLRLEDYEALGRIRGSIEAAVERAFTAADKDHRIVRDRDARLALLKRGLIPWLAGIDPDTGNPRRQTARVAELPEETRPLIKLLVEERLLSTDTNPITGEQTIEPAHEALLRQWSVLKEWLQEDLGALTSLESIKRAAREWNTHSRIDGWLVHRGGRLDDANALLLRADLAAKLDAADRFYLTACRNREETEKLEKAAADEREETERSEKMAALKKAARQSKRISIGVGVAALAMAILGVVAGWQWKLARENQRVADHQRANMMSQLAATEFLHGNEDSALRFSVLGAQIDKSLPKAVATPSFATAQLASILAHGDLRLTLGTLGADSLIFFANFSPDGKRVVTASWDGIARIWDVSTAQEIGELKGHQGRIFFAVYSQDGKRIATASEDKTARVWDAVNYQEIGPPMAHHNQVLSASFNSDGTRIVTASQDKNAHIWDVESGREIKTLEGKQGQVYFAEFSRDGKRIVTSSDDNVARIWDAASGSQLTELRGHQDGIAFAGFSHDGTRVVTASLDNTARIWDTSTGKEIKRLTGHSSFVYSANFSPDGSKIVTASFDNTARIWDAVDGHQIRVLPHDYIVESAAFSEDGKFVVTASDDNTALIWNIESGRKPTVLGHRQMINSAGFSPDGSRVVTTSWDNTARIWNAVTGVQTVELRGHQKPVNSAEFSRDGTHIITVSQDKTLRIWNAATGVELRDTIKIKDPVHSAAFSQDGNLIVAAFEDKSVHVWNAATGEKIGQPVRSGSTVNSVTFSPDGMRIVTASADAAARIWEVATGNEIGDAMKHGAPIHTAVYSQDGRYIVTASDKGAHIWDATTREEIGDPIAPQDQFNSAAFSPDGNYIVTASKNDTARIWDVATRKEIGRAMKHQDAVNSAAFSRDGTQIVTASQDNTARIWDTSPQHEIGAPLKHPARVRSAVFSPGGRYIVTTADRSAYIWDAATGREVGTPIVHSESINFAAFSKGAKYIVTAAGKTAYVWDTATKQEIGTPMQHGERISFAAFDPDGARIVTASDDGNVRIWDAATGHAIGAPMKHEGKVHSAVFSPDGKLVVTASANTVRILVAATGQEVRRLKEHPQPVTFAAFSPDGKHIVSASVDGIVRIWDADTGHPFKEIKGHEGAVQSAVFNSDGTRIVTASDDKTARVWDTNTGTEIEVLNGHQMPLAFAAFSPDDTHVVTASADTTARIWDVHLATMQPKQLIDEACKHQLLAVPRLSRDDMRRFGYPEAEPEIDVCQDNL